jgi:O-antigen/teichoic acid export membrane protein
VQSPARLRPDTDWERPSSPGDETEAQRNNRNLNDLLQELRVAGLGVQMLFGFLLAIPFTVRFSALTTGERDLYRTSLVCAALSTALLVGPVAYHRWVFRRHVKGKLLRIANVEALVGLGTVAIAVCTAVWLVLMVVGLTWFVGLLAALTTCSFIALWFVLPIADRIAVQSDREERDGAREEDIERAPVSVSRTQQGV